MMAASGHQASTSKASETEEVLVGDGEETIELPSKLVCHFFSFSLTKLQICKVLNPVAKGKMEYFSAQTNIQYFQSITVRTCTYFYRSTVRTS